ncbi:MAG: FtsH protease activity modulator HflK [Candidatus Latescibacterota bacterium]|nr:MAG: FtsH protease activity modulator HflK [Candidatus Latescibacterota bacterium]
MAEGDFGEVINAFRSRFPRGVGGSIRGIIILVVLALIAFSMFYTIDPEEVGIVLRLGKYVRSTDPGLHMKLPVGIEQVTKVPVQRQLKEEFGFQTVSAGVRSQYSESGREAESNMLTGDLNAAVVEWVVQYRIVEPYQYLFRVRNVRSTFRDMTEAVVRRVVGDRTVNEVLTVGRQEIAGLVEEQLQELCNQYETGIKVEQVVLQDVNPPDQVKPSFNEVNEAQQEREKLINEAQSDYNRVIPRARGEAQQTINEAEGYALNRVNTARGDSARFVVVFDEYRKAPEVTKKRIYLETMRQILPQVSKKIVIDEELKGIIPLLNLEPADTRKGGDGK